MVTDTLVSLLHTLQDVRRQKSALEKVEKGVLVDLKPLVDPMFDKVPDEPVTEDGLSLTRVAGVSRSISADLLLERGVAPDIIAFATKTTTYYQYRLKEAKGE